MKVADLQFEIHKAIDGITDETTLKEVYNWLYSKNAPNKPMSLDEYNKAIDIARQQIKDGDYLSVEELEKQSKGW